MAAAVVIHLSSEEHERLVDCGVRPKDLLIAALEDWERRKPKDGRYIAFQADLDSKNTSNTSQD